MKGIKNIIDKFDLKSLKYYFVLSLLIIVAIVIISTIKITEAKYQSSIDVEATPNFAFFIVDVGTQTQSIQLDKMIPRQQPYIYTFNVSNFNNEKKANVDLRYSIETITTTNLPLTIKIYKGNNTNVAENYVESTSANSDGVYFKHLLYNDVSTMSYQNMQTDHYTLWISFPESYKSTSDGYNGTIELIDIEIRAEQVVD